MDKLHNVYKVTIKDIKQAITLDNNCFEKEDNRGTLERCKLWFKKNKDIYLMIKCNNIIIGYINFMPLTNKSYNLYRTGKLNDYEITDKDIEVYTPAKTYNCLLCSIVINSNYRDSKVILFLLNSFRRKLKKLEKQGIKFNNVLADCVSKDGEKFAIRAGFHYLADKPDSKLYERKIENF